jgi:hypothetical protein
MSVAYFLKSFIGNLFCGLGREPIAGTPNDIYTALALTVRDRVPRQTVGQVKSLEVSSWITVTQTGDARGN